MDVLTIGAPCHSHSEHFMEVSGHRHDLHQVLAYASVFDGSDITAVLVYPMRSGTWSRLAEHGRTVAKARLSRGGRMLQLALVGLPLQIPQESSVASLIKNWNVIRL